MEVLGLAGKFDEAYKFAVRVYDGEDMAVSGLPNDPVVRRREITECVAQSLVGYVEMSLSGYDRTRGEDMTTYHKSTSLVLQTCIDIGKQMELFPVFLARYKSDTELSLVFLSSFETLLMAGKIDASADDKFFEEVVDLYWEQGLVDRLEQVILHLDPRKINRHKLLFICTNQMVNAFIYVCNVGFSDYEKPLQYLFHRIANHGKLQISEEKKEGETCALFLYIDHCLTGLPFPVGKVNYVDSTNARATVLKLMFSTDMHTNEDKEGETLPALMRTGSLPYMRYLMSLNLTKCLKVLENALDDIALDDGVVVGEGVAISRQSVFDALAALTFDERWTQNQLDTISCFIGLAYGKYCLSVKLSSNTLDKLTDELLRSPDMKLKHERELAFNCILQTGFVPEVYRKEGVLSVLENVQFWSLYQKEAVSQNRFDLAIKSYLKDDQRSGQIFAAVHSFLSRSLDIQCRSQIQNSWLKAVPEILPINPAACVALITRYWPNSHDNAVESLKGTELRYSYLKELLQPPQVDSEGSMTTSAFPSHMYHSYIKLMCKYDPKAVKPFLTATELAYLALPFDIQEVGKTCKDCGVIEAEVWAMEFCNEYDKAIMVLMGKYRKSLAAHSTSSEFTDLLYMAIEVCTKAQSESLWLKVLEETWSIESREDLECIRGDFLTKFTEHVPIQTIILRLTSSKGGDALRNYRNILTDLLDMCNSSTQTLHMSLNVATRQLLSDVRMKLSVAQSGIIPKERCELCKRLMHIRAMEEDERRDNVIVFTCGHIYHEPCLLKGLSLVLTYPVSPGHQSEVFCVACGVDKHSLRRAQKGKKGLIEPRLSVLLANLRRSKRILSRQRKGERRKCMPYLNVLLRMKLTNRLDSIWVRSLTRLIWATAIETNIQYLMQLKVV
jgi:vacuolar protein sorting-associated protein 8